MGQRFHLVNLNKRVAYELGELDDSLFDHYLHSQLVGCEMKVLTADEYIEQQRKTAEVIKMYGGHVLRYRRHVQVQSRLLTKLPLEVVALCAASAPMRDRVAFALTCQTAWDIARPDLVRDWRPGQHCEGDRMLCVREGTTVDQMPPGVLNDEEHAAIRAMRSATSGDKDGEPPSVVDFVNWRGILHLNPSNVRWETGQWLESLHPKVIRYPNRASEFQDHYIWSHLVDAVQRTVTPRRSPKVLRNLTTHEYIRKGALIKARKTAGLASYPPAPLPNWKLADILIMRICWSPDDDQRALEGLNPRGAWAGHRFDFARADALPRDDKGKVLAPWKDVSDDYMKELLKFNAIYQEWESD